MPFGSICEACAFQCTVFSTTWLKCRALGCSSCSFVAAPATLALLPMPLSSAGMNACPLPSSPLEQRAPCCFGAKRALGWSWGEDTRLGRALFSCLCWRWQHRRRVALVAEAVPARLTRASLAVSLRSLLPLCKVSSSITPSSEALAYLFDWWDYTV